MQFSEDKKWSNELESKEENENLITGKYFGLTKNEFHEILIKHFFLKASINKYIFFVKERESIKDMTSGKQGILEYNCDNKSTTVVKRSVSGLEGKRCGIFLGLLVITV